MKKSRTIFLFFAFLASNTFAQYTKLLDFTGAINGKSPYGSLFSDGAFLYGTTYQGGTDSLGVVFKIKPNGTGYSKMLDFTGIANGNNPAGSLISDGTFLYGTTVLGGINNYGTIFKIMPDGTGYSMVHDFVIATDGISPYSSLIFDGTFFYGMTSAGGTYNMGVVFKIKSDGTGYSKLLDFDGAITGSAPYGDLISVGTFLYGMTNQGGAADSGTVFKIKPDGTGYVKLLDFIGANGSYPYGSLISDGTFLYGMPNSGGTNNYGTIFKIKPDGTGYAKLLDFDGVTNGLNPQGSLISQGAFFYGMTVGGGTNGDGTIFKIKPDGSGYSTLYGFPAGVNGRRPYGSLISDGTFFFGMTNAGGTNSKGTVFKFNPYCSPVTSVQTITICAGQSLLVGNHTHTATGTFTDILSSYQFCDSTVTTHLTILPANTFHQTLTRCAGNSITVGTHTYTASGSYNDVFTSLVNGCDSAVITSLTVLPANTFSQTKTVCPGQSITVGSHTYSSSGTYTDVLISLVNSCDSTVTTHLTVLLPNIFYQTKVVCEGHSVTVGTHIYTTSGTYNDELHSYHNCDSTVTTYLTVLPANTFSQTIAVCDGHSLTIGSNNYTSSGTFTDVLISMVSGCDSTLTTHLNVLPANTFSQAKTLCSGQSLTIGSNTYTTSGTYTDVLSSLVNGCDSTVTTHLSINSIDTSVSISNVTITAVASPATYQWIDCNNGNSLIAGQTNQSYTAASNGSYAVIITNNNCSDISSCYSISTIGITENNFVSSINISPNPFNLQTDISFSQEQKKSSIKIIDMLGKEVKSFDFNGKKLIIEKGEMQPGIYFLQIKTEKGIVSKKLIINR